MTDIKLIALDLDGTLLDSRKRLSDRNREALRRCAEQGMEIVPCTGRIWMGIPEMIRSLPGVHYAITVNGAVVMDIRNWCAIDERKLSMELALDLMELAQQFDTMYDGYVDGCGYGERRFLDHMEDYGIPKELQQMILDTRRPVENLRKQIRTLGKSVEKVNYFFRDPAERLRAKAALERRGDVVVSSSYPVNLEINAPGATKGDGLLRLAAHLGIVPSRTMGFGDGENDESLMTLAGIGVCMSNGMERTLAAADYVTLSNDEDGVAAALEHFEII